MKAEDDTPTVEVQAEPYDQQPWEVSSHAHSGEENGQVDYSGAAHAVAVPLKAVTNPMDAMDGWTLLVTLLVSSIIVFVAACVAVGTGDNAGLTWWAFAGSLISIIVVIVLMVLKKCAEEASIKAGPFMMIGLLVLWVAVDMPCTFASPFSTLSNGWIGCWASLIVSGALASRAFADKAKTMSNALSQQQGNEATKYALFLGMTSIVVLIAGCFTFSNAGCFSVPAGGLLGYSVAVAVISIVGCVVILIVANVAAFQQHSGKTNMIISIFLIVWWACAAFILTFWGPFTGLGCSTNGFIATWVAIFAALSLFKACGLDTVKGLVSKAKAGRGGAGTGSGNNNNHDGRMPEL